jgi:ABC-type transporter Mla MlaB component
MILAHACRLKEGAVRQTTTRLAIDGPISREDLPGLYQRACSALARAGPGLLICELGEVAADAVAVEALVRLALAARRHGCQVRVRGASTELRELAELMGLGEALPE